MKQVDSTSVSVIKSLFDHRPSLRHRIHVLKALHILLRNGALLQHPIKIDQPLPISAAKDHHGVRKVHKGGAGFVLHQAIVGELAL